MGFQFLWMIRRRSGRRSSSIPSQGLRALIPADAGARPISTFSAAAGGAGLRATDQNGPEPRVFYAVDDAGMIYLEEAFQRYGSWDFFASWDLRGQEKGLDQLAFPANEQFREPLKPPAAWNFGLSIHPP